ncbi:enoyl-ACP reductase FabV [Enterococcus sp. AZ109]|uniref:enoyl-ACP reductase FabV n=1 Tax=Enterococcus sp. AZ109 TaxID=2774634 RepID=UPI003F22CCC8
MEIRPIIQNNVCRNVNPYGCQKEVLKQISLVKERGYYKGPKKVLILGASSSYGLATRISTAFGSNADTIGVSFERGPESFEKMGTAGWYNNIFFKQEAEKDNLIAKNFIGDAFSNQMKEEVIRYIKEEFGGKIDLLVYSLAAPKRVDEASGKTYVSKLKPVGQSVRGENIDLENETIFLQEVEPATEEEIEGTIKVMGGEDWESWVEVLLENQCLTNDFQTVLYSYIGPECTHAFYHKGSLGLAKKDTERAKNHINELLSQQTNGRALISVSKVVTTKASAVIPILPMYCIALYKVMMEKGTHETSIMHKDRLLRDMMYGDKPEYDELGRLRPDSWELDPETQDEVNELMKQINQSNFQTDLTGYQLLRKEFLALNGFDETESVDLTEDDLTQLKFMAY